MLGTLFAVFVTSVLGSTHCVGMCGPFVLMVGNAGKRSSLHLLFTYHLGRLFSYALLGALAGLLGYGVIGLGALSGISGVIVQISGYMLIVYGISLIWSQLVHRQANLWWIPEVWQKLIQYGYRSTRNYSGHLKAMMIGFYSGFLPCGWLYAYVMLAIGTQSVAYGAGVLIFFWLGTVPALTGFSWGIEQVGVWFKSRTQIISAMISIMFGIMMATGEQHACCQAQKDVSPIKLQLTSQKREVLPQQVKGSCCQP